MDNNQVVGVAGVKGFTNSFNKYPKLVDSLDGEKKKYQDKIKKDQEDRIKKLKEI